MSQHSMKGPEWERVRMIAKNRAGGMCENLCGRDGNEGDHIVPLSMGGAGLDPNNVRWLCKECNQRKGSRINEEQRQTWKHPLWFKD